MYTPTQCWPRLAAASALCGAAGPISTVCSTSHLCQHQCVILWEQQAACGCRRPLLPLHRRLLLRSRGQRRAASGCLQLLLLLLLLLLQLLL
jgi:hypothetical protein